MNVTIESLDSVFRPKSIAVIGASGKPGKIGYALVNSLVKDKYKGPIYPINPRADEILGLKVYSSLKDIPGKVEAAVITVPAKIVLQSVEECGQAGVKGLIIITSGFSEVGERDLEEKLVRIARKYGMRILGPNIVGTLCNSEQYNASFAPCLPLPGKASLISQSGALLIALDAASYQRRVGFDKLISIGNIADINFADIVEWLEQDENTSCISLYVEGFKDGRRFMEVCRKSNKPIVALKSGGTQAGAAAAASHTGSLAGAAKVYDAAFDQAGVIQARHLDNLFDLTFALSQQPPMSGDNLLIITNGGGVGVLATDSSERFGLPLRFAPEELQESMKKHMPSFGSARNPVDLTGMAGTDWYEDSIRHAIAHEWVDAVCVLYCETAVTVPIEIGKAIKRAVDASGVKGKPVSASFVGGEESAKAVAWMVDHGIPAFEAPNTAVEVLGALRHYAKIQKKLAEPLELSKKSNKEAAMKIIAKVRAEGRKSLTEVESKDIFTLYDMPVATTRLTTTEDEAAKTANEIGYPIVMKIVSPDILHKSDAGGVKVGIKDEKGVREAYNTILRNAKAYKADADIKGLVVQEMAPNGTEVIMGSVNDPAFGPTMMFGLGGIFVEVLKDVTFRVAPVAKSLAMDMLDEIRGAPILAGARGEAPRDRATTALILSRYSNMAYELGDEISESDANPVLVYEEGKGVKIVDARIILKDK